MNNSENKELKKFEENTRYLMEYIRKVYGTEVYVLIDSNSATVLPQLMTVMSYD